MSTASDPRKRRRFRDYKKGKVPEQHPKDNRGKVRHAAPPREVDESILVELPIVRTTLAQPDFPHCHVCLDELQIEQRGESGEREIMCPKSLRQGRWVAVPASRAQTCTKSTAPLSVEEQRAFFART